MNFQITEVMEINYSHEKLSSATNITSVHKLICYSLKLTSSERSVFIIACKMDC